MKRCCILPVFFIYIIFAGLIPGCIFAAEYSLDDLYRIALKRAEKIKVWEENLYIAETGREKAMSLLLPKLSAFGSYVRYTESKRNVSGVIIQPDEATSWGLRLDESLSMSGRELTALSISKDMIFKNRFELHAVREEYLLNVAVAYFDVLKAKKSLDIAEANLERLRKYRNAAEKRLKIGEVTKTVLLRADGELSGVQSDYIRAKNTLELSMSVLARIAGIETDFTLKELPPADIEMSPISLFQEHAVSERADLRSLEIQKQITEKQVQFTRGSYWPNLALSGVYTAADQSPAPQTLNRESIYGGVSLNFPFFEGGLRFAEVKEARAKERQAGYIYEDFKKTIEVEVQSVYLDIMTQRAILKFQEDQLAFAKDNFYAVSKQFEFGLSNSLDVMDANTPLVSAERKMAEEFYRYQLSLLRMKKATGTLLKKIAGDS